MSIFIDIPIFHEIFSITILRILITKILYKPLHSNYYLHTKISRRSYVAIINFFRAHDSPRYEDKKSVVHSSLFSLLRVLLFFYDDANGTEVSVTHRTVRTICKLYSSMIVLMESPGVSRDIDFATRFAGDVHSAAHIRKINP